MPIDTAPGQPAIVWIIVVVIAAGLVTAAVVGFWVHSRRPWWH